MQKIDEKTLCLILGLLALNYSYSMIISTLKQQNISVSKGLISKINKDKENFGQIKQKSTKRRGRPRILSRTTT